MEDISLADRRVSAGAASHVDTAARLSVSLLCFERPTTQLEEGYGERKGGHLQTNRKDYQNGVHWELAAGGESESGRLEREIVESRARLMDFNLIRSTRK